MTWRDLIYAILWIVSWTLPPAAFLRAIGSLSGPELIFAAAAVLIATAPGVVFTIWYVGRHRGS